MSDVMAQAKLNMNFLSQAITGTQQLRSTVTNVFNLLCEGVKPDEEEDGKGDDAETAVTVGKDGKKFLQRFQEYLEAVNKDYNEVEKMCNNMTSMTDLPVLGPSGALSLDSIADKNSTYRDAVLTYQWNNRLHEYAQIATSLMLTNQIKRSQLQAGAGAKRRRAAPPKFTNLPSQTVDNTLQTLSRQLSDTTMKILQASGDTRIVHLAVGRVFVVIIVLRSLTIEKVLVKGLDENIILENNTVDLFSDSQYLCMQKITDHAMSAVLQYSTYQASPPEFPLKYLLYWLQSYKSLFTDACTVCGKHLDNGLPPLWRDFKIPVPCHDSCRA
uniref:Mediator of RNA polymerase II transcription subunit 27-like n=1 Tax=Phallusia mammillata TaxID=59560 RepID=A0A6F9DL75_9ASCI|nr:mediator of RNA polymerase II transcription subunit 27-like [Phallusia mammillata]